MFDMMDDGIHASDAKARENKYFNLIGIPEKTAKATKWTWIHGDFFVLQEFNGHHTHMLRSGTIKLSLPLQ